MSRLTVSTPRGKPRSPSFTVFGIGLGMVDGQISHAAVSAMPPSQACRPPASLRPAARWARPWAWRNRRLVNASLHGGRYGRGRGRRRPAWLVLAGCGCLVFLLGLMATVGRSQRAAAPGCGVPPADAPPAHAPPADAPPGRPRTACGRRPSRFRPRGSGRTALRACRCASAPAAGPSVRQPDQPHPVRPGVLPPGYGGPDRVTAGPYRCTHRPARCLEQLACRDAPVARVT